MTAPPDIERIRGLAELTVLAVDATEIVRAEIGGYTGGTSLVLFVHGTVTLAVDLSRARFDLVDEQQKHLVVDLPQPSIRRAFIDQKQTRVLFSERHGLWRLAAGDALEGQVYAQALASGRDRLEHKTLREDAIDQARRHTKAVLSRFVGAYGWTTDVHWCD